MRPWLSDAELRDLTGRVKPSAQRLVLARNSIPFRVIDGRPVVLRESLGIIPPPPRPRVRKL
jgi:hypothetical protein